MEYLIDNLKEITKLLKENPCEALRVKIEALNIIKDIQEVKPSLFSLSYAETIRNFLFSSDTYIVIEFLEDVVSDINSRKRMLES